MFTFLTNLLPRTAAVASHTRPKAVIYRERVAAEHPTPWCFYEPVSGFSCAHATQEQAMACSSRYFRRARMMAKARVYHPFEA